MPEETEDLEEEKLFFSNDNVDCYSGSFGFYDFCLSPPELDVG